jgi:hypothetical protein
MSICFGESSAVFFLHGGTLPVFGHPRAIALKLPLHAEYGEQTIFTLTCTGLDGSNIHETATAGVVPVFEER